MTDGVPTTQAPPPQNSLLRRRNTSSSSSDLSTPTTTTSTPSPSSSSSQSDFELISIKPVSYVSLKDILPTTAVSSPRPAMMMAHFQAQSPGSEISIRNRLVKQAAWAYLQPMSTSPDCAGNSFLHRLFTAHNPFSALLRALTRAVDWLLRSIRIRSSR